METIVALLSGFLVALAVWLMLSGNLLRFLFGLLLLSNGINLAILAAGRLTAGSPPLLGAGGALPAAQMANALPQALLLTAIVIGFGLFAFALALTIHAYRTFGHLDVDRMRLAEPQPPGPKAK
ncbi:putative monovalent cation/H+ antiporter subunit C (plasmid) [Ketogulonicigenium robustum]|uniref:Putative monovalent cation/H+ antiporter subunit C n=1 Tax=Ketogulonicigenium robustum TaxID=92947 RepID=A0A1W6P3J6_9RHOB|nr:NADH-quinone oxidoreductase subunit K [Ketogulonicigenium robustum]ARO15983.1 putative monovalent cation/H+ antiporter subunit C [Ketogulonicigenium robustum]